MAKSRISKLIEPYVITKGRKFRLKDIDPGDTGGIKADKAAAKAALAEGVARLRKLQEKLYAQNKWGVLLIFQALDAAGKGGAIEHVMSGVNPAGVEVCVFKAPSQRNATTTSCGGTSSGSRARPHRHLRSLVLRGSARRPGPPRDPRE